MKYDLAKEPTRGAKRTLAAFKNEMFLLLASRPFEEIAVNEICDRAGYPRATFYNYFDDKYDLLNYCWQWLASQIRLEEYRNIEPSQCLYIFFDRIFDFTEAHRDAMEKMLQNNGESGYMFSSFRNFMTSQIRSIFKDCTVCHSYSVPNEMVADHYSNTLLLVWQWCCRNGKNISKEDAHNYLAFLIGHLQ